ncbi:hypothetical protein FB567DRAFT_550477 [Paraphoma chrysanthemicola]|uniref:Uncharacterized protein n=1 Tax=Paraphoma chrysanthemicola TaxID=798071 RepID=A0A8K0VXS0_9PLEO|nr:hypothetical protein FB567DRAFT_550477 [Paraphoma chrysanthemicola]
MSGVLTMQIVHALFPSLRSPSPTQTPTTPTPSSTPPHSRQSSTSSLPRFHISPAENLELRPLLSALNAQPAARHRRSSSASSRSTERGSLDGGVYGLGNGR